MEVIIDGKNVTIPDVPRYATYIWLRAKPWSLHKSLSLAKRAINSDSRFKDYDNYIFWLDDNGTWQLVSTP